MLHRLRAFVSRFAAETSLHGAHHLIVAHTNACYQGEAAKAEAEAEQEWWQDIVAQDAEDEGRIFHEENERWSIEVQKYEDTMRDQDEEIKRLDHTREDLVEHEVATEEPKLRRVVATIGDHGNASHIEAAHTSGSNLSCCSLISTGSGGSQEFQNTATIADWVYEAGLSGDFVAAAHGDCVLEA